jgi:hypothetical protein
MLLIKNWIHYALYRTSNLDLDPSKVSQEDGCEGPWETRAPFTLYNLLQPHPYEMQDRLKLQFV